MQYLLALYVLPVDSDTLYSSSVVQTWVVLRVHIGNVRVTQWVHPDEVKARARVIWSIPITKLLNDVMQGIVFPADEYVARPRVSLDCILHAVRVISVAVVVDRQSEVLRQRSDCVERTLSGAVCYCQQQF